MIDTKSLDLGQIMCCKAYSAANFSGSRDNAILPRGTLAMPEVGLMLHCRNLFNSIRNLSTKTLSE